METLLGERVMIYILIRQLNPVIMFPLPYTHTERLTHEMLIM